MKLAHAHLPVLSVVAAVVLAGCFDGSSPTSTHNPSVQAGVQVGMLDSFPVLADTILEVRLDPVVHELSPVLGDEDLVEAVRRVNGVVLIGFKPPEAGRTRESGVVPAMSRSAALASRSTIRLRGASILRSFRNSSNVVARIPPELAPILRRLPIVNYLEPETYGALGQSPAQDTGWGAWKVGAPWVWANQSNAGNWASITIFDSGIDSVHRWDGDLDGPENLFADCLYVDPIANTCYQGSVHGSIVASIISARNNTVGTVGIAYNPWRFSSVRVCDDAGSCPQWAVASGLDWATSTGWPRHIVNMSIQMCEGSEGLADAVTRAVNAGILMVSIAGNTSFWCPSNTHPGTTGVTYPGRWPEVIGVSGTMPNDGFADPGISPCTGGSRFGAQVDLAAPFWVARGMGANGGWTTSPSCGTSFAAPVVAAVAAMVWTQNPSWSAAQVRQRLQATAVDLGDSGVDDKFGFGRVSALNALYTPPPPSFSVSISGPDLVQNPSQCLFTATYANGDEPVAYAWTVDGSSVGDNSSTYRHFNNDWNAFELGITVTDGQGRVAMNFFSVSVSSGAPECLDQ